MEDAPAQKLSEKECECPCDHKAQIEIRVGFVVCNTGKEALCEACVHLDDNQEMECHVGHA